MPLNHPATFVSRLAYEKIGWFNKNLKVAMDYDLVLRLFLGECTFVYVNKVLASMRYGGASDENLLDVVKEVYAITTSQGYPCYLAGYWGAVRLVKGSLKLTLRALGLHSLLRLHPRFFRSSSSGN
jgi:GT2 family glycosyltransferase